MSKTFRERLLYKNKNRIKKYPRWKGLVLFIQNITLFFYGVGCYLGRNGKKCIGLVSMVMVFFLNSSFSFITSSMPKAEEVYLSEEVQIALGDTVIEFQEENTVFPGSHEMIDDSEVMEEVYDEHDSNITEEDLYFLDDIFVAQEANGGDNKLEVSELEENEGIVNQEYTFDKNDWRLVLINKQHPIPEDYEFELGTIKNNMRCDKRILEELYALMKAASKDGISVIVCSPYRDYNRQTMLFNRKIDKYMGRGMSYMEAFKEASQTVTVPGASEHQIGLAIDFVTANYTQLNEGFGDTDAGKWLLEHSCEYGFILRYPKGKEYITGIEFEPWHFRYVGKEAATVIMEQNITLEEFWEDL